LRGKLSDWRVLGRVGVVRDDGQEWECTLKLLGLLDEEEGEFLGRLVPRNLFLLRKVVRFFCPSAL
jgi:hypothetical protein